MRGPAWRRSTKTLATLFFHAKKERERREREREEIRRGGEKREETINRAPAMKDVLACLLA